jgi:hypothetical protein
MVRFLGSRQKTGIPVQANSESAISNVLERHTEITRKEVFQAAIGLVHHQILRSLIASMIVGMLSG